MYLQWYSETDLDLKVTDPCGQEIRYKKRTATYNGGTGKLDVDANVDSAPQYTMTPQENVYIIGVDVLYNGGTFLDYAKKMKVQEKKFFFTHFQH